MKVISLHSGGLDSTVLLTYMLQIGHEVRAIAFDYGQRHRRELESAKRVCEKLGVPWRVADITALGFFMAGSSQTSENIDVPEGHYEEESMKQTVVPNRNMIMLSIAGAWAQQLEYDAIAYAAHAGDHAIYPDCRESFVYPFNEALRSAHWHAVNVYAPFLKKTKAEIVELGHQLGAPLELTWSCYKGGEKHCGKCGTCVERREAFQLSGLIDPTGYE